MAEVVEANGPSNLWALVERSSPLGAPIVIYDSTSLANAQEPQPSKLGVGDDDAVDPEVTPTVPVPSDS